ncbi:MAG: hypothetical protein QOK43_31 [Acidimicrobiaceae bacterium]|jgi:hypothetical protein|nr:hypothetical protein [Acidimicrobiaceae bacterium]MDQ1444015.1 hypothetical protein [Acidimicrobiaceae bacterium]
MDRRAAFFLIAAAACLAVVPVGVEKFRAVAVVTAVVYAVLAVLSFLDHRSRRGHGR